MFEDEKDELLSALYVFVGEKLVSTAIKESDDTISVDITEIGPLLCKENDFVYANGQYACSVKHVNSDIVYSKTYNESALNLCPISNKRVRISLKTLIEDLGYSEKCASNGSIVVIQGYNVDSTATASEITGEDIMSLYYSLLPIVGDAKDLIEGHYGRDIITGERFSAFDRVLCIAFSIVPFFADTGVRVGKKGFVKIDTLVDLMGKLHVDKKTDLITDIWRTLKPATRDFCFEELFSKTIYTLSNGWHHVGKEMNGCFPVIDFVKVVDNKLDDTIAVSLKTLDPDRYLKSDGLPNIENIQAVLESYIKKIKDTKMFVINDILGNVEITQKQLDIVVPSMRVDVFDSFKDLLRECGIKVEIIPC